MQIGLRSFKRVMTRWSNWKEIAIDRFSRERADLAEGLGNNMRVMESGSHRI
jgi:hypothetical protein